MPRRSKISRKQQQKKKEQQRRAEMKEERIKIQEVGDEIDSRMNDLTRNKNNLTIYGEKSGSIVGHW